MGSAGLQAIAALGLALATTAAAPIPHGSITVGFHHWGSCIGKCPCFDTTLRDDGTAVAHSCDTGVLWYPDEAFRVTPDEAAEFRRALQPLRDRPPAQGECVGPPRMPFRNSAVIAWNDRQSQSIKTCEGRAFQAVARALLAIGAAYWDGRRVPGSKRELLRRDVLDLRWAD